METKLITKCIKILQEVRLHLQDDPKWKDTVEEIDQTIAELGGLLRSYECRSNGVRLDQIELQETLRLVRLVWEILYYIFHS